MLNKSINAYPHNCCVDVSEDLHIKYEIPNAQIDKCSILVNRLDSGNCVAQRNESFDSPTNKIDINMGKFLTPQKIVDRQEISLDTKNYFDVKFDKGISLDPGDILYIRIEDGGSWGNRHNLYIFTSDDSLTFENITINQWEIVNEIMPTGIRIKKSDDYEYTSGSYVTVDLSRQNNKEYSWNSFYWKTPSSQTPPDKICTVTEINNDGTIRIEPKAESKFTFTPTYIKHPKYDNAYEYTRGLINSDSDFDSYTDAIFKECGHKAGDDTSSYCSTGVLEDYFGYTAFTIEGVFFNNIKTIGFGKCVINIYKDDILVSRARCLAYDHFDKVDGADYIVIVDNEKFMSNMSETCDKIRVDYTPNIDSFTADAYCYKYSKAEFYNIDDFNKNEDINGIVSNGSESCVIKNCKFMENNHEYELYTIPSIVYDVKIGDKLSVWLHNNSEYNTTPTYYFRTKTPPTANVVGVPALMKSDGVYYISDIKHKFKISYESDHSKLNYFYLYLYELNPQTNEWALKERSPMLYNPDEAYEFSGFIKGQKYKIYGVCTDNDGDEWDTAEVQFDVRYNFSNTKDLATFNKDLTTIDISFDGVLSSNSSYPDISLEVYKILKSNSEFVSGMDYVGGGLAKINNIICFDMLRDYNIKNDSCYDYYVRVVAKKDGIESISFVSLSENVYTDFSGTSILGIEKISDTQLNIAKSFNLFYSFDKNIGELTNEISREYINSFSRYPKELKGHQNYISGNCSGLLGSECNGIYEEPKGIRDSWKDFVNDDTIKFYRGIDGETMIISIESSKIKPSYFPGVGIVNEVYITFKELSSTKQYAVFSTGKTGD